MDNSNTLEQDDLLKIIRDILQRLQKAEAEILRLRKVIQGL